MYTIRHLHKKKGFTIVELDVYKRQILYIREHYYITEQYNDRSLNFVQTAEENLKAQFENKSGEFDLSLIHI